MKKKTTMQDIATSLHISKVTVHRALSGKQEISDDLRKKIIDKSVELNYHLIDPLRKTCKQFYFLLHKRFYTSREQYYFNMFRKINAHFSLNAMTVELKPISDDFTLNAFQKSVNRFNNGNFGLIVAGKHNPSLLKEIADSNIPAVCLDYYNSEIKLNYIYINNYLAGSELATYLIKNGHRKICFIGDITHDKNTIDKCYGFLSTLNTAKISNKESFHINLDMADTNSIDKLRDIELPNVTAFILDCDQAASNLIIYLKTKGYNVPNDFSIASFDNTPLCNETKPTLTSIGANIETIVKTCYNLLLEQFKNPLSKKQTVVLFSTLYERNSVALKQ